MTPLLGILQALEVELHHPGVRCDRTRLEALLHPQFHELGRSGRAYTRDTVVEFLVQRAEPAAVLSDHFACAELGVGIGLLTYRSAHRAPDGQLSNHTLRSSLWVRGAEGWQLRYHQGTPAAESW